ncbi:MAG TPA: hypothetical protein VMG82_29180 [Candidatus Sulfotelmatobacter sp.]|nr:hypothetical protein [Candidatus Sulfotelmatobacter sp.]
MRNPATPAAHSRLRRALIFLTVVWSIGAAFLALQATMTELSWFGSSNALPADIVLPKQSKAAFEHCQEIVKGLPQPLRDPNVSKQAGYVAWQLGYLLGTGDATLGAGLANRAAVEDVLRQSVPVTTGLGIPPLALPQHGRSAYAMREFTLSLEEDTPCVAAALQFRYSPRHAALYKFSAAVGFASVYRRLAPQLTDVLAPELRVYGSAAGIPEDLYTPLLGHTSAGAGPDGAEALPSVVNRIDAYIKNSY